MPPHEALSYPIPSEDVLEPPARWAELRDTCPVAPVTLPSGDEAVLVTRYDDVRAVLADPRFTRTSAGRGARVSTAANGGVFSQATAVPQHGEEHLRWRRMIGKWFTARRMTALRPGIEAMADRLVDDMVAAGAPADLKAALGFPLPVWVICDMLGVPDGDRDLFARWSDARLSTTRHTDEEMAAADAEFRSYASAHIAAKRKEPGDDLLSALLSERDTDGAPLSDELLIATAIGLLVAGHETTANMIGKMVAMLLADRSRWEELLADRSLVRSAVEETLRMDANAGFGMVRYFTEDVEIAGTTLPSGTTAVCSMAAANRDERQFTDADRLDLHRSPNPHLSFGAGAHACIGQPLARTELQAVLDVLLRRLPSLDLAVGVDELRRVEGLVVGGLRELPVRW